MVDPTSAVVAGMRGAPTRLVQAASPVGVDLAALAQRAAAGDVIARHDLSWLVRGPRPGSDALAPLVDELASLAAAGSRLALEVLLEVIDGWALARPSVRQVLIDDDAVDDAVQDVLVAVAEAIQTFRGESRFTTWLHQVARHKAIAVLRRRRDHLLQPGPDHVVQLARFSSAVADRATVAAAVAALPDRYRTAVALRDIDGLSYAEVAAQLGLPLNTTRTRIARGRSLAAARMTPHP